MIFTQGAVRSVILDYRLYIIVQLEILYYKYHHLQRTMDVVHYFIIFLRNH